MAEADKELNQAERETSGAVAGLLRAFGTVLGVHIQYAQREAKSDLGRIAIGLGLIVVALLFVALAVLFGHLALAYYLDAVTPLDMMGAVGVVAAGDLALALVLLLIGRSRLKKPVLEETRSLVKRTVESFADV